MRRWLDKPYLIYETESLIYAAQEQGLATKYTGAKILGTGKSRTCRLYKEQNETIQHIVSGWKRPCDT